MKIQLRVLLLMISMTTLAMATAIVVSSYLLRESLKSSARVQLSTVLTMRHSELTRNLNDLRKNMSIFVLSDTTSRGLSALRAGYAELGKGAQSVLLGKFAPADDNSRRSASPMSGYDKAYSNYAPTFHKASSAYGWEDMYLVDPRGNVVFSVLRNGEFATNLVSGPWKDTGLARAVMPLLHDAVPGTLSFADFSVYSPKENQMSAFLAMPVFGADKHEFLGVAAIQFPIQQINALMADETGLGETGEALLVGKDGWMLSNSRFDKFTNILRTQLKSAAVQSVLQGAAGQGEMIDYRNQAAFEVYRPIQPFPGALGDPAQWGVIVKMDKGEVLQQFYDLCLILLLTGAALALATLAVGLRGARSITRPLMEMKDALNKLSQGEQTGIPGLERTDEIGEMAHAAELFRSMSEQIEGEHWIAENVAVVTSTVSSELTLKKATDNALHLLCEKLEVPVGAIYLLDKDCYRLSGSHGLGLRDHAEDWFPLGVGVIGQCAKDREPIVISPVLQGPAISTGLAEFQPHELVVYPIQHKETVFAVIEFAALKAMTPRQHEFLKEVSAALGLHLANLQSAEQNALLLEETRRQSQVLKEQQDTLLEKNQEMQNLTEELRAHAEEMKAQNEELRANQEELRAQQEEMKHKNLLLEVQSSQLKDVLHEVETKANDLQRSNQYKSEFLANMSHELRTPLNSVLILSRSLADNEDNNLTPEQVESAKVIGESGSQLLTLINDILDLSKIEAGKLELHKEEFRLDDILAYLRRVFSPQAEKKHLDFDIQVDSDLPEMVFTDRQRLTQILTNLIANAIKFTDGGGVKVLASKDGDHLLIDVTDTGIGIPADKLEHIFGVFQQVDGSTSRKFGGSGLGLAISRHLAGLLGGEIVVQSQLGKGSTFTIRLVNLYGAPQQSAEAKRETKVPLVRPAATPAAAGAAHSGLSILVVEDDTRLQAILERMIKAFGFSPVCAGSAEQALELVARNKPAGILLDLGLPQMSGMEMLRRLKADESTAGIPVYIMSGATDSGEAKVLGAKGFLKKPVTRDTISAAIRAMVAGEMQQAIKRILLVDDSPVDAQAIGKMFRQDEVEIVPANSGTGGLQLLQTHRFDTVILDMQLQDMTGFEWLKRARDMLNPPPVVIYSASDLSEAEVFELKEITESIVTKSPLSGRLREEVLLTLRVDLGSGKIRAPDRKSGFGKKLLLVDDDAKNLYALTKILRSRGYEVEVAADGGKALEKLAHSSFEAVLTDIMMPDMDGYELIRQIRSLGHEDLPIVAITAKAMQGDAELCMQAGANAYLPKPVDTDKLFELLRRV